MSYHEISVTTLEKNARRLVKDLEAKGFKVEMTVFKTGPGGTQFYGPSYVELEVTDPSNDTFTWVKFLAGGYAASGKNQFGDGYSWTVMKKAAMTFILKSLGQEAPETQGDSL